MIPIAFTGTSDKVSAKQIWLLNAFCEKLDEYYGGEIELHHGDCINADAIAHAVAVSLDWDIVIHPPNIRTKRAFCNIGRIVKVHKPLPYLDRNHQMVDETVRLIAVPKGLEIMRSGTWATVRYARKLKHPIKFIYP